MFFKSYHFFFEFQINIIRILGIIFDFVYSLFTERRFSPVDEERGIEQTRKSKLHNRILMKNPTFRLHYIAFELHKNDSYQERRRDMAR
jgi:hypothetical protein